MAKCVGADKNCIQVHLLLSVIIFLFFHDSFFIIDAKIITISHSFLHRHNRENLEKRIM